MNKIFLILSICGLTSCGIPNYTREKIDIARFTSSQINGTAIVKLYHNGTGKQSLAPGGEYIETATFPIATLTRYREYYSTGELRRQGLMYWGQFYGIHKIYGKDGKAIKEKEINYEKPYKFSLGKLSDKMQREFNINIYKQNIPIHRSENPPIYQLTLPGERRITIDANTGNIISNVSERANK
jgi:hypothetical protein